MKLLTIGLYLVLLVLASGAATAQVTSVGPFVGAHREDFESLPIVTSSPCYPAFILDGTAELCAANQGNVIVAGTSNCLCGVAPQQGSYQALVSQTSSAGTYATIRFAAPALRFGGYFALNCSVPDATARFFDLGGNVIANLPLSIPANCTWRWHGFSSTVPLSKVELRSNLASGGILMMDALEVDNFAGVQAYCTGKSNSLGCVPGIEVDGVPSANGAVDFDVRARGVTPSTQGMLLYNVNGARAALPFYCGTLCFGPNGFRRTKLVFSTGFGQLCEGVFRLDMNDFAVGALGGSPNPALLVPGTLVHCQWWGRDAYAPGLCQAPMSNALEYVVQ